MVFPIIWVSLSILVKISRTWDLGWVGVIEWGSHYQNATKSLLSRGLSLQAGWDFPLDRTLRNWVSTISFVLPPLCRAWKGQIWLSCSLSLLLGSGEGCRWIGESRTTLSMQGWYRQSQGLILQQKFCYHVFKITVYQHTLLAHLVLSFSTSSCVNPFVHQHHHVLEGGGPSVSCPSHLIIQGWEMSAGWVSSSCQSWQQKGIYVNNSEKGSRDNLEKSHCYTHMKGNQKPCLW